MKILLVPVIIILIPIPILFLLLQYLKKRRSVSTYSKVALGFSFLIFGLLASFFAMIVSINGMGEKEIWCATGAVAFLPLGFIVNIIGIPLLLVQFRNGKSKSSQVL